VPETKTVLLRLEAELADRLKALAEVEGRSVSEVIREAIADHVERRRRDPEFRELLAEAHVRHRRLMRLLSEDA